MELNIKLAKQGNTISEQIQQIGSANQRVAFVTEQYLEAKKILSAQGGNL